MIENKTTTGFSSPQIRGIWSGHGLEGARPYQFGNGRVREVTARWEVTGDWRLGLATGTGVLASRLWGFDSLALDHREDAVDCRDRDFLDGAAGPVNFELVNFGCCAEAEMDTLVGGGGVTAATENIGALANPARGEEHFCAGGIARALRAADQF